MKWWTYTEDILPEMYESIFWTTNLVNVREIGNITRIYALFVFIKVTCNQDIWVRNINYYFRIEHRKQALKLSILFSKIHFKTAGHNLTSYLKLKLCRLCFLLSFVHRICKWYRSEKLPISGNQPFCRICAMTTTFASQFLFYLSSNSSASWGRKICNFMIFIFFNRCYI